MESGCIIEYSCPVCGEMVWEDEWDIVGNDIIHETCRGEYNQKKRADNRLKQLEKHVTELENKLSALEERDGE